MNQMTAVEGSAMKAVTELWLLETYQEPSENVVLIHWKEVE